MATGKGAELETIATAPSEGRRLTVRQSHIRTGGTTRIHETVRAEMGFDHRALVEVSYGERSVAVHLFADHHVPVDQIVLRRPDMDRLGVPEGEQVVIRPLKRGRAAMRDAFGRFNARLEAGFRRSDTDSEGGE